MLAIHTPKLFLHHEERGFVLRFQAFPKCVQKLYFHIWKENVRAVYLALFRTFLISSKETRFPDFSFSTLSSSILFSSSVMITSTSIMFSCIYFKVFSILSNLVSIFCCSINV